ncbi:MAG: ABC transporter permease [Oscillospiraceae bacterium]|jgi:peptide/nickel transport system permease protein|nr:ABC transporter permease [Oscillospiraceae bacterium]
MKNTLRQVFRSGKFVTGFVIFSAILLLAVIYPIISPGNPLQMIGLNSFIKPGTYVSVYDSLNTQRTYTFKLPGAAEKRIDSKLSNEDRLNIKDYLLRFGLPEEAVDIEQTHDLLALWWNNYDPELRLGSTIAENRYFARLDDKLAGIFESEDIEVGELDPDTGEYVRKKMVTETDYVNVSDVANVIRLPLGTDNFGRDTFRELVSAIGTSLQIGLIAGTVATLIGLLLGLLAGYLGGVADDIIMFFSNLFTVIPGFVLLILIAYSIDQSQRGVTTVAIVIGLTSWVWTTRSVRAQVISLRSRDHVNLSKLSGHSLPRLIITDILPYIASYVVMAFILQISSGILAEAGLSMLGLGPKTTDTATLGLMMDWAMRYTAHISGAWWAYYPVVLVIALVSFSLNLMNTGLDQIFNPQLRD